MSLLSAHFVAQNLNFKLENIRMMNTRLKIYSAPIAALHDIRTHFFPTR